MYWNMVTYKLDKCHFSSFYWEQWSCSVLFVWLLQSTNEKNSMTEPKQSLLLGKKTKKLAQTEMCSLLRRQPYFLVYRNHLWWKWGCFWHIKEINFILMSQHTRLYVFFFFLYITESGNVHLFSRPHQYHGQLKELQEAPVCLGGLAQRIRSASQAALS